MAVTQNDGDSVLPNKSSQNNSLKRIFSEFWWKVKGNNDGSKGKCWGQHGGYPRKFVLSQVTKGWMSPCKCTFHLVGLFIPPMVSWTFPTLDTHHFPQAAPQDSGPHHLLRNVVPKYTILHLWPNMTWEIGHPSIISTKSLCVPPIMGSLGLKQGGEKLPLVLSPALAFLVSYLYLYLITPGLLHLNHYSWFFETCRKNVNAHPSVEANLYWEIPQISQEICHPPSKQSQMSSPKSAQWGFLGDSNLTSFKPQRFGSSEFVLYFLLPPIFLSCT